MPQERDDELQIHRIIEGWKRLEWANEVKTESEKFLVRWGLLHGNQTKSPQQDQDSFSWQSESSFAAQALGLHQSLARSWPSAPLAHYDPRQLLAEGRAYAESCRRTGDQFGLAIVTVHISIMELDLGFTSDAAKDFRIGTDLFDRLHSTYLQEWKQLNISTNPESIPLREIRKRLEQRAITLDQAGRFVDWLCNADLFVCKVDSYANRLFYFKRYSEALRLYTTTKQLREWLVDSRGLIDSNLSLANTFNALGRHNDALAVLEDVLKMPEASKYDEILAQVYKTIGNIHFDGAKYPQAKEAYERSAQSIQRIEADAATAHMCYDLGLRFTTMGLDEEAPVYFEMASLRFRKIGDTRNAGHSLLQQGINLRTQHKISQALQAVDMALELLRTVNDKEGLVRAERERRLISSMV